MDDRLALLQFLVRHAEVKGLTMELCNKSIKHRQGDPDAATRIIAKLNKLENDIESLLDVTTASLPAISAYQQTILAVLRHECTISLNRPLLATAKDTPDYKAALQSCISAARSIINILATYLSRASQMAAAPGPSSQATITPLLWPSFTWAVWQSAFIVVYAAIEGQLPKSSASRYVFCQSTEQSAQETDWCLTDSLNKALTCFGTLRCGEEFGQMPALPLFETSVVTSIDLTERAGRLATLPIYSQFNHMSYTDPQKGA